jgi:biopolymer transport protein ExbD
VLTRPSSRTRRGSGGQIELNLVPILDSLVTLISFLMLSMSFLNLVSIESPFPMVSPETLQRTIENPSERPLQLTVSLRESEIEVWSPFDKIEPRKIAHLPDPLVPEGKPDTRTLHETLIEIKKRFPTENSVVLVPTANTDYDSLIVLMDAMRTLEKSDPPIFRPNPATGTDEALKTLFPEVVFGNLLGDA